MNDAPHGYDPHTERKLAKLQQRRQKLETKLEEIDVNGQPALEAIGAKLGPRSTPPSRGRRRLAKCSTRRTRRQSARCSC